MFVKRGHKGRQIKMIQNSLDLIGYDISTDGVFGPNTEKILKKYQEDNGLTVDGIVGTNTYKDLLVKIFTRVHSNKIGRTIVRRAETYIGQEEISGNMGFKTPWFHKLMVGVGFKKTHPWCAYFTELCWKMGYLDATNNKDLSNEVANIFSPSVMRTWNNFGKQDKFKRSYFPTQGSLIIFQSAKNRWFGHIEVVKNINMDNPFELETIGGNTNDSGGREGYIVAEKIRELDFREKKYGLNLIGFVHPEYL